MKHIGRGLPNRGIYLMALLLGTLQLVGESLQAQDHRDAETRFVDSYHDGLSGGLEDALLDSEKLNVSILDQTVREIGHAATASSLNVWKATKKSAKKTGKIDGNSKIAGLRSLGEPLPRADEGASDQPRVVRRVRKHHKRGQERPGSGGHDREADLTESNSETRQEDEHEGELKLILSSNLHDRDISENFIAEKNLGHEPWERLMQ